MPNPPADPEGTQTRSEKERSDYFDALSRQVLGQPPRGTDNPDGVPDDKKGRK